MNRNHSTESPDTAAVREMLAGTGYAEKAIEYYIRKAFMGDMPDADQVSEMVGSCGDTMKVFLKVENSIIKDIKYQVLGCPGAVSSAMAAAKLVKGKDLQYAGTVSDNDIFSELEDIPAQKHHCIQLAVKTLHKAVNEYGNGKKR